jgi:hypothetical protein
MQWGSCAEPSLKNDFSQKAKAQRFGAENSFGCGEKIPKSNSEMDKRWKKKRRSMFVHLFAPLRLCERFSATQTSGSIFAS